MYRWILRVMYIWGVTVALYMPKAWSQAEQHFEQAVFDTENSSLPYRLLYPENYDSSKQYPVVVFLHGAGERGTDNQKNLNYVGSLFLKKKHRENFPCFVLVPQCPEQKRWVEVSWSSNSHTLPDTPSVPLQATMQLLRTLENKHTFSKHYLVGLSMGGYGVWDWLERDTQTFDAAVVICGGASDTAPERVRTPLWIFHGAKDNVVPVARARRIRDYWSKVGPSHPQSVYTEYAHVKHGSWIPALKNKELLPWLFQF